MKVSVVIPTFGRPDLVRAAAASALAQKLPPGWSRELIVVDDGGTDGSDKALKGLKGLRYLWKAHAGPAAARNHGARAAKGDILAFLDSDTVAAPGWLSAGLGRLAKDQGLFGVEGRAAKDVEGPETPFTESVTNLRGGRWLTCNLFVRRAEFLALGGFDERFKRPVREDSEFAFRALEAGKRFVFEPKAAVLHPVRTVGVGRYFFHAREGKYEALIERQHPESYRRHFKWLDGRQAPVYFLAHYAAPFAAFASLRLAGALLAAGAVVTLYAWCRGREVGPLDPLKLAPAALLIPYSRLFWVVWGYFKYPSSPE